MLALVPLTLLSIFGAPQGPLVQSCQEASRLLKNLPSGLSGVVDLGIVGPYLPRSELPRLLKLKPPHLDRFFAVGRSRRAFAMRLFYGDDAAVYPLGRALGLLTLGDASQSALIQSQLKEGDRNTRRELVLALSLLPQNRPRMLLWNILGDPDPELRLVAARVIVKRGSRRAARVLSQLLEEPKHREAAISALLDSDPRWLSGMLSELPVPLAAEVEAARFSVPTNRRKRRAFERQFKRGSLAYQSAAWGVAVSSRYLSLESLIELSAGASGAAQAGVQKQRQMAELLSGRLQKRLRGPLTLEEAAVFLAYTRVNRPKLSTEVALQLADALSLSLMQKNLPDMVLFELLKRLSRLHREAGVKVAQNLLDRRPSERWTEVALRLVHLNGDAKLDLARVLWARDSKSPTVRAWVYAAAGRLCGRAGVPFGSEESWEDPAVGEAQEPL